MKVVFLANSWFTIANFRLELINELSELGAEVTVIGPSDNDHKLEQHGLSILSSNIRKIHINRSSINIFKEAYSILMIYNAIKDEKPDILLNYTIKPMIYGSLMARMLGIGQIYSTVTGVGYLFSGAGALIGLLRLFILPFLRLAISFNSAVFFQNKDDLNLFKSLSILSNTNYQLVNGSGVNLDKFKQVADVDPEYDFLMVGRLLKSKGVQEFIEASAMLRRKYPNAKIALAGSVDKSKDSISDEELLKLIDMGDIIYLGHVPNVFSILVKAKVFVLPSYREGTPRSTLEAMAVGLPIITTDVPGCRETVEQGKNGLLVVAKSALKLFEAMEALLYNDDLIERMGQRSRSICEERFDVKSVNKKVIDTIMKGE